MNKYRSVVAAGLCLLILTGCQNTELPDTIDKTTLSVNDVGEVTLHLVDAFDKDYYNVTELESMAVEDAAAYNTTAGAGETVPVTVESVEMLENGKEVKVTYQYNNADSFEEHMEGILFYGTVTEAMTAGYHLEPVLLNAVKDGEQITGQWLMTEAAGKHLLITNQKAEIYSPYKVTHISEGVVYNDNGSVDTTQAEGEVYILMKK